MPPAGKRRWSSTLGRQDGRSSCQAARMVLDSGKWHFFIFVEAKNSFLPRVGDVGYKIVHGKEWLLFDLFWKTYMGAEFLFWPGSTDSQYDQCSAYRIIFYASRGLNYWILLSVARRTAFQNFSDICVTWVWRWWSGMATLIQVAKLCWKHGIIFSVLPLAILRFVIFI